MRHLGSNITENVFTRFIMMLNSLKRVYYVIIVQLD
jgi:hypothetical protein